MWMFDVAMSHTVVIRQVSRLDVMDDRLGDALASREPYQVCSQSRTGDVMPQAAVRSPR
jgi:hypothetical protein